MRLAVKMMRGLTLAFACLLFTSAAGAQSADTAPPGYRDLVELFEEFRAAVPPEVTAGVPDYSARAMRQEARRARRMLRRVETIDDSAWSR